MSISSEKTATTAAAVPKRKPSVSYATPTYVPARGQQATGLNNTITNTTSRASRRAHPPDLSFPYLTQDLGEGATNEYRAETAEGYIRADDPDFGLHPVISMSTRVSRTQTLNRQKSKIDDKKLVTWKERDPENPWNWGVARRWCKSLKN